ncbi:MAG: orotate phosphoribosyltransferase [Candidatus Mcinerneyibacterium aminivorans]|jgi:orotate phosphoribosyltransferase|uniref:Orotate phosphoribosyltransferase n=1 Tax=Candidatus Mcinerneyibacterium aminivorans TaxID=2703815 RepID=A0A5D0MBF7_9BACT|nr:MAG: orotate phosphoribosyltransferase [Candidatus Mcinerneyibacterium aminivorans]
MEEYKKKFVDFMLKADVLMFGDFVTKSGRNTPFFINTGKYSTGKQISKLGDFYAKAIKEKIGLDFDVIFGPAYKGIPLVVAVASSLLKLYNKNVSFCFNRKEKKDHGEKGSLIGHKLNDGDKVLIIEDVTTSGKSIRETVPILRDHANIKLAGLIISVNRMEKGKDTDRMALTQLKEEYEMETAAIVDMKETQNYLHEKKFIDDKMNAKINEYYKKYGASE